MWTVHRLRDHIRGYQSVPGSCMGALSKRIGDCTAMCRGSGSGEQTPVGAREKKSGMSSRILIRIKESAGMMEENGKGCEGKCSEWKTVLTKVFLILVNFSFLILGWFMVVMGIWLHVHQDSYIYTYLLRDNPTNPVLVFERIPILFIAIGFVLAGMSFLGCCGACADSVCFLSFYTILLVAGILAELVLGIFFLSSKEEVSRQLAKSMQYQVKHEYNKTSVPPNATSAEVYFLTIAWDTLQSRSNCCGATGPQDYHHSAWYNSSKDTGGVWVPQSCCKLSKPSHLHTVRPAAIIDEKNFCQVEALIYTKNKNESAVYLKTQGCQVVVTNWLYDYEDRVSLLIAFLILIQMISLVLGCAQMSWMRKKATDYWFCEEDEYEQ